MLQAAHPGDEPFHAHPEAAVGHAAELSQIDIPAEGLTRQTVLVDALQQQIQIVNALPATDHFAVTFGRDEINAEHNFGTVFSGLEIKRLNICGVAVHHHRTNVKAFYFQPAE